MKRKITILLLLINIIILVCCMISFYYLNQNHVSKKLYNLNLKDVNNLMIIAHPDDESLWGGVHLSKSDYLVVCVTCGSDKEREKEFEKAIGEFGNKGISLNFPDVTNNKIDNWSKNYYEIEKELKKIINYKDWNMIVTHNPIGEYDHIHHRMISTMVTNNSNKDKLYYFNKYYTKEELEDINYCMKEINDRELYAKTILLNDYPSQSGVVNNHSQNIKYEKFISYKNWN